MADYIDELTEAERILARLEGPIDDGWAVTLRAVCKSKIALIKAGLYVPRSGRCNESNGVIA